MSSQVQPGPASIAAATAAATAARAPFYRRIWIALTVLLLLLAAALIPPYLNVNRLQRRITTSISASLGRPVHLDNVTLTLLPFPGFTLDNFIVSEDPAFGFEPTIRANTVTARIRLSTLWRRRIEISRITFTDPSVNLVHTSDGKWNLDSILLQAARISTAPTAQRAAGPAPRFPYIEATGARLNLKLDRVKTPFSLTEADFSLWLPSPEIWHFRITARPARTDVPVGYSGLLHLEGTLGRAPTLAQIPIDLRGEWRTAPLGEVSRIVLGQDAGWRGDMTLNASTHGTVGSNELHTAVRVTDLHRIGFVPPDTLTLSAACDATLTNAFAALPNLHCAAPIASPPAFTLAATISDIRHPAIAMLHANLAPIPAAALVPLLQTFSQRIPARLALGGTLSGDLDCDAAPCDPAHLQTSLDYEDGTLATAETRSAIPLGDLNLHSPVAFPAAKPVRRRAAVAADAGLPSPALLLPPTTIALGGREPALLEGRIDLHGITLRLTGSATPDRLAALGQVLPQFGDDLPESLAHPASSQAIRLDLTATRAWGGPQVWRETVTPSPRRPALPAKLARAVK